MKKKQRLSGKAVQGVKGLLSDLGGIARKPLEGIDTIKSVLDGGAKKKGPQVLILMGSASDWETMKGAAEVLSGLKVSFEMDVASAHRMPEKVAEYAKAAREHGVEVIVCGAGMAAHLAGAVAANTTLPVIGVPLKGGTMDGLDALLSTVQMPPGIPVATVAVGGARNAAFLAAEIISIRDAALAARLEKQRSETRDALEKKAEELRAAK